MLSKSGKAFCAAALSWKKGRSQYLTLVIYPCESHQRLQVYRQSMNFLWYPAAVK